MKFRNPGDEGPLGAFSNVTKANYFDLAKSAVRARGGEGVKLTRDANPRQWAAWQAYFAHLGLKAPAAMKTLTVPADWPTEFDLDAPPTPMRDPEADRPISAARRRELANMLRGCISASGASPQRPQDARQPPQSHEDKLAKLKEDYAHRPAEISTPEMAEYLARMRREYEG